VPSFVRDGSGPCNWVPDPARSQGQTIPFAILPFAEMPKAVNPANGFFVNANNDPAGVSLDNDSFNERRPSNPQAIYYLNDGYGSGLRAGRITQLVRDRIDAGEKISVDDMKRFQGNTQQLDAELLVPFLIAAFEAAELETAPAELAAFAEDPALAEAIGRLRAWDFSTPTGIPEGYDAGDSEGVITSYVPSYEAKASVAATIYNVWRAKAVRSVVDATLARYGLGTGSGQALVALHHLLSQSPFTGIGASGVDFFPAPATLPSAADRRDHALLAALRSALDALASSAFANAFGGSTVQNEYRWGKLHRITLDHPLGAAWSIPTNGGFANLSPALPGIPRDGGFEVVNASGFGSRSDTENAFRFGSGPNRRYVGTPGTGARAGADVVGFQVIPGGRTAIASDPTYAIQLPTWLTADYHPMEMFEDEARRDALEVETYRPPAP
jgi:penicillin amidase